MSLFVITEHLANYGLYIILCMHCHNDWNSKWRLKHYVTGNIITLHRCLEKHT